MIKQKFVIAVLLFFAILVFSDRRTFSEEYLQYEVFADSHFTQLRGVCVDKDQKSS